MRFCEPSAAQLHIYHTIRGLQRAGHEVSLLALQGRKVLFSSDLQVFNRDTLAATDYGQIGLSGSSLFKRCESGLRRLQSELHLPYFALFDNYRMVDAAHHNLQGFHLVHERFNLLALGGAVASRRMGIPFVLEVNADLIEQRRFKGIPERGIRRLYAHWATRFCFRSAAKVICISDELKEHLRSRWKLESDKLAVLPCAADVAAFTPDHDAAAVRQRLGLSGEPVIMWVGGFYPWHDLNLLLESFALVLKKRPDARLVLVGDGQMQPAVRQRVMSNGLRHAVIMTGAIPQSSVPEILSIADIAVVPSAPLPASRGGTGAPLKLFEYMAAGKAIVATALDQNAEVIEHHRTGIFVEPDNPNAFAEEILTLLGDPEKRRWLGKNARREAVANHSWEHYTRELEAIYLDVLR